MGKMSGFHESNIDQVIPRRPQTGSFGLGWPQAKAVT